MTAEDTCIFSLFLWVKSDSLAESHPFDLIHKLRIAVLIRTLENSCIAKFIVNNHSKFSLSR